MDAATLDLVSAGSASLASGFGFVAFLRARRAPAATTEAGPGLVRRLLAPVAVHLRPTSGEELELLTNRLATAGRRSRDAIDRYCEERVGAMLAGMALALTASALLGGVTGALVAMVSLVLGILGPSKLVDARAAERREAIGAALPSAIDLLTTCIDAGLTLEHAMTRVAREIDTSSPILAGELVTTAHELEAGVPLADGLRRLSRRVGLDDLSALCGVLAQAHGLGAPIGNTLREFAASSRRARMSTLEERAGKLAAQMTIPLAVCLLPAAMLIIIGPAALQLVRALH
jgi:tight adherence protein C